MGYTLISKEMENPYLRKLCERIGYDEGLPVCTDPKILLPKEFLSDCINKRISNPYMPDTPQRIATDTSQKLAVRFGETISEYKKRGRAEKLEYIPLVLGAWLRYLVSVDDDGKPFEQSPDPRLEDLKKFIDASDFGKVFEAESLKPLLSDKEIFGINLFDAGLADKVLNGFNEMNSGIGAVAAVLKKYIELN